MLQANTCNLLTSLLQSGPLTLGISESTADACCKLNQIFSHSPRAWKLVLYCLAAVAIPTNSCPTVPNKPTGPAQALQLVLGSILKWTDLTPIWPDEMCTGCALRLLLHREIDSYHDPLSRLLCNELHMAPLCMMHGPQAFENLLNQSESALEPISSSHDQEHVGRKWNWLSNSGKSQPASRPCASTLLGPYVDLCQCKHDPQTCLVRTRLV